MIFAVSRLKKITFFLLWLLAASTPLLPLGLMPEGTAVNPVYVAQENPFKIGVAPERPVYAPEFVFFLEKKAAHEYFGLYPDDFDSTFMSLTLTGTGYEDRNLSTASIICRLFDRLQCTYSVINRHEYDIICGLQSEKIQKKFNAWRNSPEWIQNPTLEEDCHYIIALIQSDSAGAEAIKNRYPEAQELFDQFDRNVTGIPICNYYYDRKYTKNEPIQVAFGFYPNNSNTFSKKIFIDFSISSDPIQSFKGYEYFTARKTGAHTAAGEEEVRFTPSELYFSSNIGCQSNSCTPVIIKTPNNEATPSSD
ncbi:MAG: hypothetical protein ACOYK6_02020 [Chthoniobacterales bacterium]